MLQKRVQEIVELYWAGNVKAAAKQLGIPHNTLYRIASGETPNPRANVLAKIAKFAGSTVEYLLTGEGRGPQTLDAQGRPKSGARSRWYALVDSLYPERGGVREVLDDLPWGLGGLYEALVPQRFDRSGNAHPRQVELQLPRETFLGIGYAWCDVLEEAVRVLGADVVRKRLDAAEFAVAGGCLPFAIHLQRVLPKAQVQRLLKVWKDELTRGDGSPE